MPSTKAVKRRIASVTTTKKIMRAMNMVAASKLQKNRARLETARPFFHHFQKVIEDLQTHPGAADSIFFNPAERKQTGSAVYLVITGDRGLCGGYNINLTEKARSHMAGSEKDIQIVTVGSKGYDFFRRQSREILRRYSNVMETAIYEDAGMVSRFLTKVYTDGETDEVYVAYTKFGSVLQHIPTVERLLPVGGVPEDGTGAGGMRYESGAADFLGHAVPAYLNAFIYAAMLESSACEQAARMVSMDAAVKNAADIIEKLTRVYNRSRQAAITQEISELVASTDV
ncbi:MAG: ATP synthase F1 subunit gamma [Oscillospiraceae bacterium]|nr:ATP synthase F1 subunit gamma [Oscillospiraceae bacterium]